MESNYSLSDIAAVTDGGISGGMGGWWMIILFALIFGNGGGVFGGNNRAASVDEVASGFNFSGINSKLNDISAAIASEGRTTDNAICTLGYNSLQQNSALSAQMANCCCDLKTAIHAEGEATRNMIQQNKIESLQQQVNQLNLQQAMCGVLRWPTSATYAVGCNPFFNGCGYSSCNNI